MSIDGLFNNATTQPKIWVEKVYLFETIDLPPFREITLEPGLNIIWAEEAEGSNEQGGYKLGHGVGKTSLCRLLRYCLGEKYFAPRHLREQISATYPNGYVAAKVWIVGEMWVVAKPLGSKTKTYFVKGGDISSLFTSEQRSSKEEYLNALHQGVFGTGDSLILPGSGQPIAWEHILSWCSRDQEAHLDNFSVWRAPRSESDSPAFNRPTKDPVEMVRVCLGFMERKELALQKACQRLESEIEVLERKVEQTGRQPRFFYDEYLARVKQKLGITGNIPVSTQQLSLAPDDLVGKAEEKIEKDRLQIEKEGNVLSELDQLRVDANSEVSLVKERLAHLEAVVDFHRDKNSDIEKELESKEKLQVKLKSLGENSCELGNISFNQCEYALKYRESFKFDKKQQTNESKKEYKKRLELIDEHSNRIEIARQSLRDAQKEYLRINTQYQEQNSKIRQLESKLQNFERELSELNRYEEVVSGRVENKDFVDATKKLEKKQKELKGKYDQLKLAKQQQVGKAGALNSYINALADAVYPGLQGRAVLDDIARPFQLLGPGGEAFHALEVIIGDLSAALFVTNHPIVHPGFIIHDSPREADMGDNLYRGYFRMLIELGRDMRKKNCFPVQYIVATTTMPVSNEGEDEFISHRLHGYEESGLLFKRRLHGDSMGIEEGV